MSEKNFYSSKMPLILDIQPIWDDGLTNCLDALLQAYAKWRRTDYELMYVDNWKFEFSQKKTSGFGIWKRGNVAARLYFDDKLHVLSNLAKFHGIQLEMKEYDRNSALSTVDVTLRKGQPVLISVDTYNIPWLERFYKRIHSSHRIMIVGKNSEREYYCNDTRPYMMQPIKAGKISEDFIFCKEKLILGLFSESDCYKSIDEIKNAVLENLDYDMFKKMREFSLFLSKEEISYAEFAEFDGGIGIVLRAIRNIVRARCHYLEMLKYLNRKGYIIGDGELFYNYQKVIENWTVVKNLFYKITFTHDYWEYNNRISQIIRETSVIEEKTANTLIKRLNN